jgi:hypothetical protein
MPSKTDGGGQDFCNAQIRDIKRDSKTALFVLKALGHSKGHLIDASSEVLDTRPDQKQDSKSCQPTRPHTSKQGRGGFG